MAKAKRKVHRKLREEACATPDSIWKAVRKTKNRAFKQPCLLNIRKSDRYLAKEPQEKIEKLKKALMPTPHAADISDPTNFVYPNNLPVLRITQKKIFQTGNSLLTNKAPGPDEIPNEVIKVIMPEITGHLEQIFNDSLSIGYYPAHFRESVIVILRKLGGNKDYTNPKNYCPISLLNTIGKIMKVIIAVRISYMATTHELFPTTLFGGRRGSCVETAIHHLLEKIYAAWNENIIASPLMMDVSAAYPNTSHQCLLQNLQKRKINIKVVDWVASFLTDRHTIVKTNEQATPKLSINLGLPQGSPLSSILYLFYNRDLLDDFAKEKVDAQSYIDDITLIATGKSVKSNS